MVTRPTIKTIPEKVIDRIIFSEFWIFEFNSKNRVVSSYVSFFSNIAPKAKMIRLISQLKNVELTQQIKLLFTLKTLENV